MNLGEILNRVRVEILDDPKNEEFPGHNLWYDDELTAHVNWAIREACIRAKLLFDKLTDGVAVHTIASGQYSVRMSKLVLFIERAWFDGSPLAVTDEDQLARCYGSSWENRTGVPQAYYLMNNTISLFPKPLAGGELNMRVCRLPIDDLDSLGDEPEIDEQYHQDLLSGIASRAYLKQDAQCLDKAASADQMALFDMSFGKPVSAKTVQHQRNRVQKRTKFRTF